jgi:hypothetical protein
MTNGAECPPAVPERQPQRLPTSTSVIVFRGEDQSRLQTKIIISLLMNANLMNRSGYTNGHWV